MPHYVALVSEILILKLLTAFSKKNSVDGCDAVANLS